jgi:TolB-like protein
MVVHASMGRTAHALRVYKALWDLLDDDYAMEPSAATQALVADIKLGVYGPKEPAHDTGHAASDAPAATIAEASRAPASHTEAAKARLVLCLQPVDIQQVDTDKSHLVLGFRQLLIASLVRFREWHVTDVPIAQSIDAHREIGTRYELLMFASQARQVLQVTLMLKELDTGFFIWSDGFELSLDNWFDSQRRVIRRVAMALNVYLSAERLRRFSGRPEIEIPVYERWLHGQMLVRTFNPQHWGHLTRQFNEIIASAPQFVPAYCGLADMHTIEHIAHPGVFRSPERERTALTLARKAVELDAADIHAHRCLAWAHAMMLQFGQAELHIQIACDLNPNDSWTAISAALLLAFCGDSKHALELSQSALDMTLSPSRTYWAYEADIQFLCGNYAASVEAADQAQDVLWGGAAWRTAALAHLGRLTEARTEGARFLSRVRDNWFGKEPPTDATIVRWLLHLYPIRNRADWERLRDGLSIAGLPTDESYHVAAATAADDVSSIR